MKYNFDEIIDRKNTFSVKYSAAERGKPEDTIPLWVADMDFKAPPCVLDALTERVNHGIFGYSEYDDGYFAVLESWLLRRFSWKVERDWLVQTPGIVTAVHIALEAFTKPGDSIIIQEPVYYPFASAVRSTGRKVVVSPLRLQDGKYYMDFEDFEKKITDNNVKLFILCSPHNPVGRVWTEDELIKIGEICLKHNVLVIADEIHQDFVFDGHRHYVFSGLRDDFKNNTITCTAPSKTFNLAGLQTSNIFIPNKELRDKFEETISKQGLDGIGIMGIAACKAAYEGGEEWLEELKVYIKGNADFIDEYLKENLPQIKLIQPEGTYLAWIDFRETGLDSQALDDKISNKARLWLNNGSMFGHGGDGFMRMNLACPRSTLRQAIERIKEVF